MHSSFNVWQMSPSDVYRWLHRGSKLALVSPARVVKLKSLFGRPDYLHVLPRVCKANCFECQH